MSVTPDVSHEEMSPLNSSLAANIWLMSVTPDVSHEEMSPLNLSAPQNIPLMSVTCEVFQPERSWLKKLAPENIPLMLVTRDVSQCSIDLAPHIDEQPAKARSSVVGPSKVGTSSAVTCSDPQPANAPA